MVSSSFGLTAEDLRSRVDRAELDLENLVRQRAEVRRDVAERDAIAHMLDLAIYAANAMVEIYSILLARMEIPRAQQVWDRYLSVYLHAALDAYPKLAGKAAREFRRLHEAGASSVDAEAVSAAHRAYKDAIKQVSGDRDFMRGLAHIRNTVGAHHLTSPGNSIDGLVAWVELQPHRTNQDGDALVFNSLRWVMLAFEFGQTVMHALNASATPAMPGADEYAQREAALDAQSDQ